MAHSEPCSQPFAWNVYPESGDSTLTMILIRVIVARIFGGLALVLGGSAFQLALWKRPGTGYLDALWRHSYLWFLYLFLSLLLGEHSLKWLNRYWKEQ